MEPPRGISAVLPFGRIRTRRLRGPDPWPTALIAMVANPARAKVDATRVGAPKLLSLRPCPKTITGYPEAGIGELGRNTWKSTSAVAAGSGTGAPVGVGGIICCESRKLGDWKDPKATRPTPASK